MNSLKRKLCPLITGRRAVPTPHCCRMSWRSPWDLSHPAASSLWRVAGIRPWIHPWGTWGTAHTANEWLGGGISLPSPVCFPCMGKEEAQQAPLSVTRWAAVSAALQMDFPLTTNAIIHQDLVKSWKQVQNKLHCIICRSWGGWTTELPVGNQTLAALYLIFRHLPKSASLRHSR